VSKKRRENQQKRQPLVLHPIHYVMGAGVVALSAILAVVVFTLFVGTDFGKDSPSAGGIPAPGAESAAERSAAADLLDSKSWDAMAQDERDLVRDEVNRAFADGHFRAASKLVAALDVFKEGGETKISRLYQVLVKPTSSRSYAQTLTFYCSETDGTVSAYEYFDDGQTVALKPAVTQDDRSQPWGIVISAIDWSTTVDIGFDKVDGHRVHGLRFTFTSKSREGGTRQDQTDYWFDTDSARLLARQLYVPDTDTSATRYTLKWRSLPPITIPDDQEKPGCVGDLYAKYATG
jgi:hypothetical protein